MLTMFGAGPEQVNNVEVRTQVTHDLQLWHQGLGLTPPGGGWMEGEQNAERTTYKSRTIWGRFENRRTKHTERRTLCILANLLKGGQPNQSSAGRCSSELTATRHWCLNIWQLWSGLRCGLYIVHTNAHVFQLFVFFKLGSLHFSIFTATFVLDWEWARP